MMIRTFPILLASLMLLSCASTSEPTEASPSETTETSETFLSRPRLLDPSFMPLSRVRLTWNGVEGAEGYELQMASTEDFDDIVRSWTVSGLLLEVEIKDDAPTLWFRIRCFRGNEVSRWSAPLMIEGDS